MGYYIRVSIINDIVASEMYFISLILYTHKTCHSIDSRMPTIKSSRNTTCLAKRLLKNSLVPR